MSAADDDASTVPEEPEDLTPSRRDMPERPAPYCSWSAAEQAAVIAATLEWHADAAAVSAYRDAWIGGPARTCCWERVGESFFRRTGRRRAAGSLSVRFFTLLAQGLAVAPPNWLTRYGAAAQRRAGKWPAAGGARRPPAPAAAAAAAAAAQGRGRKRGRVVEEPEDEVEEEDVEAAEEVVGGEGR